jgi:DNA-directed RNA polymerase specialized sigma24 family protein
MQASEHRATTSADAPPELVRAAFRELHGTRLHGFALLLTMGDRARAARLVGEALAAGTARTAELRHPERAAAWLRRRITRNAGRSPGPARAVSAAEGRRALEELGVEAAAFTGLSSLSTRDRAALVADSVERLERGDVATIVGVDGARLDRLIRRVRRRYATAVADSLDDASTASGPLVERIQAIAARALT